jgi:hypothetical protein
VVPVTSPDAVGPAVEGSGEKGGLAPANLRSAYKLPEMGGSGQTVAIVDAYNDPNAFSDLKVYRETYKLSECTEASGCFTKVNQKGEAKNYPANEKHWSGEISVDLDMVSATCPGCHILLVEANNNAPENLGEAENEAATLGAVVISNSYAGKENEENAKAIAEVNSKYYDHPGIPIIASAGDEGYGVSYPASSPYVIAVGGTALRKEEKNARGWIEEVWGKAEHGEGTGSGCALKEEIKPIWQHDTGCKDRTDNDIAAVGAESTPVSAYDTYEEPGWLNVWGTSVSAPIIAGIEAQADSATKKAGAEAFYLDPGMLFHVSAGSDGSCGAEGSETYYLCNATKEGYNGPTGNGAPDGVFAIPTPTATTGTATGLTETEATLKGTVNPNGIETKYYFEYGTTESYGSKTAEASDGSGTSSVEVSKAITGLTAGTKYHYRLVATSSGGTTDGTDQTFTTTHWSLQELVAPKRMIGIGFWDPTCTSSTSCMAFGAYANNSGTTVPLVETWNGSTWSVQEPPSPAGAKKANVQGGSCISSTECVAVGEFENSSGKTVPLAEAWNGTTWSVQEPSVPTGAKLGKLGKVSCASFTECIAVGEFENSSGTKFALAEAWNGSSWSVQEPPSPVGAKGAYLGSVSCTSSTSCIAVGNFINSSSTWMPLAEKWNGTAWTAQEPALPTGGKHGLLSRVSCVSSTACTAVGGFENSSAKNVPMAEKWNGTTWTGQELPLPTGAKSGGMWGVSCVSSTECIGVGEFENNSGTKASLGEKWNGTTWTDQEPRIPTGAKSSLLGSISCVSSTACVAVGSFQNAAGIGAGLSETWNGTEWTIEEFASPKGLMIDTKLWTLSCISSTECTAIGAAYKTNGDRAPMAETWNGTTWSVQEPPRPETAKAGQLSGISCTSSTSCMAVGSFESSSGVKEALADVWNGTAWSLQEPPNPAGAKATGLSKVSCASSTECIAVGEYENSSGTHVVLAEKWNGTSWTLQEPAIPAGAAKGSLLASVSCTSSTSCVAAGYYTNSSGLWMLLIEKWNGTTWSIQETPLPTGGKSGDLVDVSCTSSTACVADGGFENSSGKREAMAEQWNGTAWSGQELPSPAGAKSSNMWGVACTSATSCFGAGEYENSSGTRTVLAEQWNGTTWSTLTPQIPPGTTNESDLGAVACTSSTECLAVGSFESSASKEIAFAEDYE